MSLSKEFGVVSSSTSGFPVAPRRPSYHVVRTVNNGYDYSKFSQVYSKVFRETREVANDKVKHWFAQCEFAHAKLQQALSEQMIAECYYGSSQLPIFPWLTAEDVEYGLGVDPADMDLSHLTGETLLQTGMRFITTPDATAPTPTTSAATTPATTAAATPATTAAATPATSTILAARKPKITVLLPRRISAGSGATATVIRPIKPGKRPFPRPVCQKPSKRATPSTAPTAAEDDLPASTST